MLRRSERIRDRGANTASASTSLAGTSASSNLTAMASTSNAQADHAFITAQEIEPALPRRSIANVNGMECSLDFDSDTHRQTSSVFGDSNHTSDILSPPMPAKPIKSHIRTPSTTFSPSNLPDFGSGYTLPGPSHRMEQQLERVNHRLLKNPEKRGFGFELSSTFDSPEENWVEGDKMMKEGLDKDSINDLDVDMESERDLDTIEGIDDEGSYFAYVDAQHAIHSMLRNPIAWPELDNQTDDSEQFTSNNVAVMLSYRFKPGSAGSWFDLVIGQYWWRCETARPGYHVVGAFEQGPFASFTIQREAIQVIDGMASGSTPKKNWSYQAVFEISKGEIWLLFSDHCQDMEMIGSNVKVTSSWGETVARRDMSEKVE